MRPLRSDDGHPRARPSTQPSRALVLLVPHRHERERDDVGSRPIDPFPALFLFSVGLRALRLLRRDHGWALGVLGAHPPRGVRVPALTSDLCVVPSISGVWPARGNVSLLLSSLRSLRPEGPTPTESALSVASQVLRARRAGNSARAMVLATDGAPTCTANPLAGSLSELRRAAADGSPTCVIGVADDAALRAPLQAMAEAGSRPRSSPQGFYSAQSPADLQLAFRTIRDQVGSCSFLTSSVPDGDGGIRVTFEGAEVASDDGGLSGWRWTDRENGELALLGPVCARAVARPSSLIVTVSCGVRAPQAPTT